MEKFEPDTMALMFFIRNRNAIEQVYGILKKKARTDNYIEAIRGR